MSSRSFYFFNATQFLGALSENTFKTFAIYFLAEKHGFASANILTLVGTVFVLPFLLFSSAAGILSDRFSKRNLIIGVKISEIASLIVGAFFVLERSSIGVLATVFLMSAQSAVFGPAKYGIIPELVDESGISKANGSVSALTALAFILSSFIASLILDLTNKSFITEMLFLILVGGIGLLTSLGIKRTVSQHSTRKINPFFLYEIYQTLKMSRKIPHLNVAMVGVSYVLLFGTFIQLNIIPYGVQSFHLNIEGGGYLLIAVSLGIVFGSLISGLISKDRIEPGLSCICLFVAAASFFSLYLFQHSLPSTVIALILVGTSGGGVLIPFNSFLQAKSPIEVRGQIMGAASFLAFVGMLLGAVLIFVFNGALKATPAVGFAYLGLVTLGLAVLMVVQFFAYLSSFLQRKVQIYYEDIVFSSTCPEEPTMLIFPTDSFWDLMPLFLSIPM